MKQFLTKASRAILWRTGLGRRLAAKFWHLEDSGAGYDYLNFTEQEVFADLPVDFEDEAYRNFIKVDSARWSQQQQYLLTVRDVLLEPERLLGTRVNRAVVEQTVVYKFDRQYPYILSYLTRPQPTETLTEAILYDGSATRNYYHHLVNAASRIAIWEKSDVPASLPVLITRDMYNMNFFQYLYQRSTHFRELNWRIVEPGQWLEVQKLYIAQAFPFDSDTWQGLRKLYQFTPHRPKRRIFLNRDRQQFGRYLTNETEVVAMLAAMGFENTFAEHLTIEGQAQLFEDTEYLVALTGAGLIQQFFMNPAYGSVIEIMPASRLMPEYYWQAYTLGMHYYDVVVGGDMRAGKDYPVDLAQLQASVTRMLANQHPGPTYGRTQLPALTPA